MQTLKPEIIEKVKNDPELVGKIAAATNKSFYTVTRWLDLNHKFLTTADCLGVICRGLNISQDKVLQKQKAA